MSWSVARVGEPRGLGDASEIATILGEFAEAQRFADLRASLERSLYASIDTLISEKGLAYIPGSVEWADFDPTATASALQITDAAERLPSGKLNATYEQYLAGFRARRDGASEWSNYTAYEIHAPEDRVFKVKRGIGGSKLNSVYIGNMT